jgi:hypothetical protein
MAAQKTKGGLPFEAAQVGARRIAFGKDSLIATRSLAFINEWGEADEVIAGVTRVNESWEGLQNPRIRACFRVQEIQTRTRARPLDGPSWYLR